MNLKQKRYFLYAAVVVVALLIGIGARYLVDGHLQDTVATAPSVNGTSAPTPGDSQNVASAAKSPSERADEAAVAAVGSATPAPAPADIEGSGKDAISPSAAPSFDIVRVEPTGEAIVAGRAAEGAEVELLAAGRVIGTAKANEAGEFVIIPERLAAGGHELTLRQAGGETVSAKAVVVSVPSSPQDEVLVVAGEPGKPSEVLQAGAPTSEPATQTAAADAVPAPSTSPDTAASPPQAPLRIGTVEAEAGRLFVQGTGPAGARATIYLNDTAISDVVVGADGQWSLTVERGLAAGSYGVRIDQVGSEGQVVARAAVPFEFAPQSPLQTAAAEPTAGRPATSDQPAPPATVIEPAPDRSPVATAPLASPDASAMSTAPAARHSDATISQTPAPGEAQASSEVPAPDEAPAGSPVPQTADSAARPPADSAHPVLAEIGTVSVQRGDSLWRISRATYGRGVRYTVIYEANADQIRDPDLIYPGQVFVMPPRT